MALSLNQELTGTVGVGSGNRVITFSSVSIPAYASIIVGVNFNSGGFGNVPAITISGGGLTYTQEASVGVIASVAGMMARIWSAYNVTAQTATITLTGSGHLSTAGDMEATVWIFLGGRQTDVCGAVDTYQSSTADPTNSAGLLEIVTTVPGSVICMTAIDWEATAAVTPSITNSGTTVVNQNHLVSGQSTHYNFRSAIAGVSTVGTTCRGVIDVTGNGTWDCAAVEVLPELNLQKSRVVAQAVKRANTY